MIWNVVLYFRKCYYHIDKTYTENECTNKANLTHICRKELCPIRSKFKKRVLIDKFLDDIEGLADAFDYNKIKIKWIRELSE